MMQPAVCRENRDLVVEKNAQMFIISSPRKINSLAQLGVLPIGVYFKIYPSHVKLRDFNVAWYNDTSEKHF